MIRKMTIVILSLLMAAALLGGCSLLGIGTETETTPEKIVGGTTTGNILNYGFGVQYGDELIFLYTDDDSYPSGSIVRSNPDTGESSLVLEQGGLFMSLVDDKLYYCTPEGVYKTALENPEPMMVLAKDVSLLQILDDNIYYIENGAIDSRTLDGNQRDFQAIENAGCLNVYGENLYYVSMDDGYIYSADLDGNNASVLYEQRVIMFYVVNDEIYSIDQVTGYINRMNLDTSSAETIVEYSCSGFNVNTNNIFYTRTIDGIGTCCSAAPDGSNEETMSDFGDSDWHIACMWNDGAIILRIEDITD